MSGGRSRAFGSSSYIRSTIMPSTNDILLFGRDIGLRRNRNLLLNTDGFRTDCIDTLSELKACLAARPYELLVLCNSLPAAERNVGISLAAAFLPEVKLLALEDNLAGAFQHPLVQVLHINSGPQVLLSAVHALIASTHSSHLEKRKIAMAQFEGTVKWFNNAKGYGFLGRNDGGADVFVHFSSIQSDGYKTLKEGEEVAYDVVQGEKGPQADQVRTKNK